MSAHLFCTYFDARETHIKADRRCSYVYYYYYTTHPSTSASSQLILTSNTLVPLSHYTTTTKVKVEVEVEVEGLVILEVS